MVAFELILYYFTWHYGKALVGVFSIWGNFLWFLYHFFSLPVLVRTLFTPWKKISERYKGGLDLQNLFEIIVINILMRIVGFGVRIIVILMGLTALFICFLAGVLGFLIWFFLPLIIGFFFFVGILKLYA